MNAVQPIGQRQSAYAAKINVSGTALISWAFLGGSDVEFGCGIEVDNQGNAYVTGQTSSDDFPIFKALQVAPGAVLSSTNRSDSARFQCVRLKLPRIGTWDWFEIGCLGFRAPGPSALEEDEEAFP
ncbi:MAG: SBBP repeat-containing protein [Acidobacteriota bacterium]